MSDPKPFIVSTRCGSSRVETEKAAESSRRERLPTVCLEFVVFEILQSYPILCWFRFFSAGADSVPFSLSCHYGQPIRYSSYKSIKPDKDGVHQTLELGEKVLECLNQPDYKLPQLKEPREEENEDENVFGAEETEDDQGEDTAIQEIRNAASEKEEKKLIKQLKELARQKEIVGFLNDYILALTRIASLEVDELSDWLNKSVQADGATLSAKNLEGTAGGLEWFRRTHAQTAEYREDPESQKPLRENNIIKDMLSLIRRSEASRASFGHKLFQPIKNCE